MSGHLVMRGTRVWRAVCVALLLPVLAAGPATAQEADLKHAPIPPVSIARYHIEPADVLVVKYRYTPEYDAAPTVQPDGYISLPMIGQVKVGGLTVEEAVAAIQHQGSLSLRDPELTLELKEFQRPRFFVTGEVGKPGEFPLHGRMGLLEGVAMAGGFKNSAKRSQIVLFRKIDDTHLMRSVFDAKEITKTVDSRNVELQPGDLLVIPENGVSKVLTIVPIIGAIGSMAWFFSIVN